MDGDEGKSRAAMEQQEEHHHHHHHHQEQEHHHHQEQYGTFQGVPAYSQPPAMGFPQPVPPPGATAAHGPPDPAHYHRGYQVIPVADGRPVRLPRLPCCGIGIGWFLFIIGFFLAAIPWYVGFFIILCVRVDYREKPGLIACTIAAVLAAIAVIIGATKEADVW